MSPEKNEDIMKENVLDKKRIRWGPNLTEKSGHRSDVIRSGRDPGYPRSHVEHLPEKLRCCG